MPKRKCIFNKALQEKYLFIKVRGICPSDELCEKSATQFSVSHGDGSDVAQHLRSKRHKNADRAAAAGFSLQRYFKNANTPTSKDLEIEGAEGVWTYSSRKLQFSKLRTNLKEKLSSIFYNSDLQKKERFKKTM